MAVPSDITARMVNALAVAEPDLDTGVGTPIRKILDTVAEVGAEITVDAFLTTYQYDIDSRVGDDLDSFAALFGFVRQQAKTATGSVLLQRTTPAPASVVIPVGARASTSGTSPVLVRTLVPAVFPRGSLVLEVPAVAVAGGGAGNIAAGSITRWLTQIEGITSVTNPAPFVGGVDVETDEQFRNRIKRTMFRNLAGTKDMYLGVALAQDNTTAAEVYGAYERWVERIEIVGGVGAPSIATPPGYRIFAATVAADGKISTIVPHEFNHGDYVYVTAMSGTGNAAMFVGFKRINYIAAHNTFYLSNLDGTALAGTGNTGSGSLYLVSRMSGVGPMGYAFGRDIDLSDVFPKTFYTIDLAAAPPVVTVTDTESAPDGIYDLSFIFSSQGSRNHPFRTANIMADRVDVWIDGERVEPGNVVGVLDSNNVLDWNATTYPIGAYRRRTGDRPDASQNSIILPLPLLPIVDIPQTIAIGSEIYDEGTDYFIVDRVDHENRGSMESSSGIEFVTARGGGSGTVPHTMAISGATNTTPVVVTLTGTNNYKVGQRVRIAGTSQTALNKDWYISAVGANTITLEGSTAPGGASTGGTVRLFHPVTLDYNFNAAVLQVQRDIEEWRMASSDVLVHKARPIPLKFFVAVILQAGFTTSAVQAAVNAAVQIVLRAAGIGGIVQISDVLSAISQVSGVDAVRMLSGNDVTIFTVTNITASGSHAQVTTSATHPYQVGDLVEIRSVAGATSMNTVWRVRSRDSNTAFTVQFGALNSAYTSGGTVRSADYATQIISLDGETPLFLMADRDQTPARAIDIHANDTEHFVLHSVELVVKSQSTWGST